MVGQHVVPMANTSKHIPAALSGGCESCKACDLPSRHFANLMARDFLLAWELRSESDLSHQLVDLKQKLLDTFVPLVLPEGNAQVEIHGFSDDLESNGIRGLLQGIAEADGVPARRVVRVWDNESGAFKNLHVRPRNLHAVTDQGPVPFFAALLGDVVELLAPLAVKQDGQHDSLEVQQHDSLEVACSCASAVAALVCAWLSFCDLQLVDWELL